MNFNFLLWGILIISISACQRKTAIVAGQNSTLEYNIKPSETDSRITKFNTKHFVCVKPNTLSKGKLLVFFPGTGANPSHYTKILKEAAAMGYHTIGLMYPNKSELYLSCFFNKDSTCYEQYRLEKFDGSDKAKGLHVDYTNSIQNRLIKLLQHLQKANPSQNWQQFLTTDDVDWSKCVIAGHSQGGGHAAFIGYMKAVDRVIIFSSIDWIIASKTSAAWVSKASMTPKDRIFAFIHTKDEYFKYPNVQKQWLHYGLDSLGSAINIDTTLAPYHNTHTLVTTAKPALNLLTPYHFLTCVNQFVPQNKKGEVDKEFLNAWAYLLGN
jgi:hypothetical protein